MRKPVRQPGRQRKAHLRRMARSQPEDEAPVVAACTWMAGSSKV
jgi:hypothetical protein